ncbi:hypothetical protein K474DRAFT_273077 [Panus rudis PR-1116 ss-1]|nr:hypothetical protein K474DRAFT_273077 [Panus rudis PR-1116 ss-1]
MPQTRACMIRHEGATSTFRPLCMSHTVSCSCHPLSWVNDVHRLVAQVWCFVASQASSLTISLPKHYIHSADGLTAHFYYYLRDRSLLLLPPKRCIPHALEALAFVFFYGESNLSPGRILYLTSF